LFHSLLFFVLFCPFDLYCFIMCYFILSCSFIAVSIPVSVFILSPFSSLLVCSLLLSLVLFRSVSFCFVLPCPALPCPVQIMIHYIRVSSSFVDQSIHHKITKHQFYHQYVNQKIIDESMN
jgi:hypothetical protein